MQSVSIKLTLIVDFDDDWPLKSLRPFLLILLQLHRGVKLSAEDVLLVLKVLVLIGHSGGIVTWSR